MADSWLTDGNCENCRRKNYCSTECKLARQRNKAILAGAVANVMVGVMTGVYPIDPTLGGRLADVEEV